MTTFDDDGVDWDEDDPLVFSSPFLVPEFRLWRQSTACFWPTRFLSSCLDRGSFLVCIIAGTLGLGFIWDGQFAFKNGGLRLIHPTCIMYI